MAGRLTRDDIANLNMITKFSSSLGLLGALYKNPSQLRNPTGRLILAMTITDLFDSVTKFIGHWGPTAGVDSFICYFQAWSIQQFNLASVTLGLLMGLNAVYLIYFKGSVDMIQKVEPYLILFAFVFPLPFSLIPMFYRPNNLPMVGDVDLWCWISRSNQIYQLYFWFLILFIIFGFNIIILTLTVLGIRKLEKEMVISDAKLTKEQRKEKKKNSFGRFIITRMLAYLIAFVVVWTPSSLNRITQLTAGTTVYIFAYGQSLISPMRGFINFVAYFYTWYDTLIRYYSPTRSGSSTGGSSHDKSSNMKKSASADNFRKGSAASSRSNVIMSNETIARSQNMGSRPLEDIDLEDVEEEQEDKRKKNKTIIKSKSVPASVSEMS